MSTTPQRECPDCHSKMYRIKLIDKTHYHAHADLEYTVHPEQRSFWMGQYPVDGRIGAFMCDQCGRVTLHGIPYGDEDDTPAQA